MSVREGPPSALKIALTSPHSSARIPSGAIVMRSPRRRNR